MSSFALGVKPRTALLHLVGAPLEDEHLLAVQGALYGHRLPRQVTVDRGKSGDVLQESFFAVAEELHVSENVPPSAHLRNDIALTVRPQRGASLQRVLKQPRLENHGQHERRQHSHSPARGVGAADRRAVSKAVAGWQLCNLPAPLHLDHAPAILEDVKRLIDMSDLLLRLKDHLAAHKELPVAMAGELAHKAIGEPAKELQSSYGFCSHWQLRLDARGHLPQAVLHASEHSRETSHDL
mmetsp:Transcript_125998/g.268847  ORF Transcript_125998/g.268847 Transcript_125998/m.268847 type:complete len:239 (+) Transcript_125998:2453-3169(+)